MILDVRVVLPAVGATLLKRIVSGIHFRDYVEFSLAVFKT
jgi:hypothetical protein